MVELLNRRVRRHHVLPSIALAFAIAPGLAGSAQAATPVPLGTADAFALLAGSTITNTGPTTIGGDIGLCCSGVAMPGFGSVAQPAGAQYSGTGGVAATAQDDLDIAYANAAGQALTATLPVDLSLSGTPATPLLPGVYETTSHGALQINTGLTLDFGGDPNAVFVFQGTALETAAAAAGSVTIVNGGSAPSACNIFWQLSSDATGVSLGASSAFKGTTMALGASVLGNGATVDGRILTRRSKAVTLDANTITRSGCSTATAGDGEPTGTPVPGGATTPAAGGGSPSTAPPRAGGTPTPVRTLPVHLVALTPPAVATVRGSAKLTGPRAPVRDAFAVWVTGRAIDRVVFSVDGKRIGTVRAKRGRTKFTITIHPRGRSARVHRLTARITFKRSSGTSTVVRRTTYYTAGDTSTRVPRFAG